MFQHNSSAHIEGLNIQNQINFSSLQPKTAVLTCVCKSHAKNNTHTLPNVNAKVSMEVCISPNIVFVLSGFTSLKLMPVEGDKTQ